MRFVFSQLHFVGAEPSLDVVRFCEFQNLAEYLWYVWLRLWTSWDCRIDLVQCRIQ